MGGHKVDPKWINASSPPCHSPTRCHILLCPASLASPRSARETLDAPSHRLTTGNTCPLIVPNIHTKRQFCFRETHPQRSTLLHSLTRLAVSLTQNTDECCDLGVGLRRERDSHMIKIRSRTGRYVLASMVEFALASRSLTMLTAPVVCAAGLKLGVEI